MHKMAGVRHGSYSNALEALLSKKPLSKKDALQSSFKKELDAIISDVKKFGCSGEANSKLEPSGKLSQCLFSLWNKYEWELPGGCLTDSMLEVADTLYKHKLYGLARVHGYRRCLLYLGIKATKLGQERHENMGDKERDLPGVGDSKEGGKADMPGLPLRNFVTSCGEEKAIVMAVQSEIGDVMCQYFILKSNDPLVVHSAMQNASVSTLSRLQMVAELCLTKGSRYWLLYNALSLIYAISRNLMASNCVAPVIQYLLWSAVAMELSVPLMAIKYLPLRTNFYVAVCECYYHLHYPTQAEEFARRALEKVQDLAQMHYKAHAQRDPAADAILKESTIKLGILIFKRMVFESRRKTKIIFRTRLRQSIKDFLQTTAPRCPTEKLLLEMFPGDSARFLAILSTLAPTNWRVLQPWTPPFISDLETELLSDIYQEMFYTGFDICIKSLYETVPPDVTTPLINHAMQGSNHVPLTDILTFVSLSYTYQIKEVTDILMAKVIKVTQSCPIDMIQRRGNLFKLRVLTEQLQMVSKKCRSAQGKHTSSTSQLAKGGKNLQGNAPLSPSPKKKVSNAPHGKKADVGRGSSRASPRRSGVLAGSSLKSWGGDLQEGKSGGAGGRVGDKDEKKKGGNKLAVPSGSKTGSPGTPVIGYGVITQLTSEDIKNITSDDIFALLVQVSQHLWVTIETNSSLLQTDPDLLVDSLLVCLDLAGPTFEPINTHDYQICKVYLQGKDDSPELKLLEQLVRIASVLDLWQVDPLLHGQLMLKLCCLYEARAEPHEILSTDPNSLFLSYNRSLLLKCEEECEKSLKCMKNSRQEWYFTGYFRRHPLSVTGEERRGEGESLYRKQMEELNAEFEFTLMRIKVKLATTIPPPLVSDPDKALAASKVSTLEAKVKQHQLKKETCALLMSQLTSTSAPVADYGQLREACGRNKYQLALLAMLEASVRLDLPQSEKEDKIKEAYRLLSRDKSKPEDASKASGGKTIKKMSTQPLSGCLHPPLLIYCSDTKMEFTPQPLHESLKEEVAYYRLFGRLATGSNLKVRTSDSSYPGLGLEVVAEAACQVGVSGLQPNQEYVFAVAAYDRGGKLLAGGIGATSRPYLAAHSLPVDTALGYCCQCAFKVGSEDILKKIGHAQWDRYMIKGDTKFTSDDRTPQQQPDPLLDRTITASSSSSQLKHFIYSVLATTHFAIKKGGYLVDQLSPHEIVLNHQNSQDGSMEKRSGGLRENHTHRMQLVQRLLVALEVCGMLNEAKLSLQLVVQVYGLLAPLLHHQLPSRDILRLLLHCHAVLMELPESVLLHMLSSVTYSVHHLMAVTMYHVSKMLVSKGNKNLFTAFCNSAKPLLLQTMPAAVSVSVASPEQGGGADNQKEDKEEHTTGSADQTPVHRSGASTSHDLSSPTSLLPLASLVQKNAPAKKKKKVKGTLFIVDSLPDEQKTAQYKAIEAFLISRQHGISIPEDIDLYGGEDPVILHAVMNSQPHLQAYREVAKFKRRPQFLEMIVHFVTMAIGRGHSEKSMEWIQDTFQWLHKRNDTLLASSIVRSNVTTLQAQRVHVRRPKSTTAKTKPSGTTAATNVTTSITNSATVATLSKAGKAVQKSVSGPTVKESNSQQLAIPKPITSVSQDSFPPKPSSRSGKVMVNEAALRRISGSISIPANFSRTALKKAQWLNIHTSSLVPQVRITKEDLEVKAVYVLMSILPSLWHKYKARKRLREVCVEEHVWRSQANLLLAYCYTQQVLDRLTPESSTEQQPMWLEDVGEWLGEETGGRGGDRDFRFDLSGVIVEGVIPVFTPSVAGKGSKLVTGHKLGAVVAAHSASRSSSSRESSSRGPSLTPPTQIVILESLQSCMKHFLQASVLALRGGHWVLLQNVARSLMNTINLLVHTLACFDIDSTHILLAGVYGMSTRPLYAAADGLLDLLANSSGKEKIPQTSFLHVGSQLDNSSRVGVAFVKQFVFLAIHTLYVHQHWEKVLALALRFDDITRHSWGDQLVPVISLVQSKLAHRVSREREKTSIQEKLDPAAHLDPGPKGYNVYGLVGHSLFTVPQKYLEKDLTKGRGVVNENRRRNGGTLDSRSKSERSLVRCRTLFQRCIAGVKRPHMVKDDHHLPELLSGVCGKKVGVSALSRARIGDLVDMYSSVISELSSSGLSDLQCQAVNELGDIYLLCGNIRLASKWWCEGVALLLHMKDPLSNWRSANCATILSGCGLWGCLLGAWMAAKLLKYIYWQQLDVRLECALLAATFLKAALTFSSHLPTSDMAYAPFEPNPFKAVGGVKPFPGMDLFGDTFRCSPSTLIASLRWTSQELVYRGHAVKALPVLWFYQYTASMMCRAVRETVYSKILRLRNFTSFPLFGLAVRQLNELLIGGGLPQESTHLQRPPEANWALPNFHDHLPLSDTTNTKVLTLLMEKPLRPALVSLYGQLNMARLITARAKLYVAMAALHPPLHVPNGFSCWIDSVFGKESGYDRVPTSGVIRPTRPEKTSPVQLFRPSSHPVTPIATTCPVSNLKLPSSAQKKSVNLSQKLLLRCEQDLGSLAQELSDLWEAGQKGVDMLEVWVEILLTLASQAVTLLHSRTAYQLSLQALRLIQSAEESLEVEMGSCDLHLWLECRCCVVRSVVGLVHPPWGAGLFSEKGESVVHCALHECKRLGEVELAASVHMGVAEHALSCLPCRVLDAMQHSQTCVELLSDLPDLSYEGSLLLSRASLLLADATCIQGTQPGPPTSGGDASCTQNIVGEEMVTVLEGLSSSIQEQLEVVSSPAHLNAHLPQRLLLASCQLRLAHAHQLQVYRINLETSHSHKTDPSSEVGKRKFHLDAAIVACQHAIQLVTDSALHDPCLDAELNSIYGFLICGYRQECRQTECLDQLSEACKLVLGTAIDHRLACAVLLKLSDLHMKLAHSKPVTNTDSPTTTPVPASTKPITHAVTPSPKISLSMVNNVETEDQKKSKPPLETERDQQKRHIYLSWAMVRTALQTKTCQQQLKRLISEAHHENVTRSIDNYSLQILPNFAALELCPSDTNTNAIAEDNSIIQTLENTVAVLPIAKLLPKNQEVQGAMNLTWIKVLNFYYQLIQRSLWQKKSLEVSVSDWGLRYHAATPTLYLKVQAMHAFLSSQFLAFKECQLPLLPQYSLQLQIASGHLYKQAGQKPSNLEQHLSAGEYELTLIWYSGGHAPTTGCGQEDQLTGYFAFNHRPFQVPLQGAHDSTGIDVFIVSTTITKVAKLQQEWAVLAEKCQSYLQMKENSFYRPFSVRSPKPKRGVQLPEGLVKELAEAVQNIAIVFGIKKKELPRLSPQAVEQVCSVLDPHVYRCVKNNHAYHFLRDLFPTKAAAKAGSRLAV